MNLELFARFIAELNRSPWAMMPHWLNALTASLTRYTESGEWSFDTVLSERFSAQSAKAAGGGAIAVVPVYGVITQRGDMFDELFGGGSVSTERLTRLIKQLAADDSVGAVVLNIDSPGGTVGGLKELSDVIHGMRATKRVVSVSNSLAASAAYWIGSAASEFVATPEGETGSIGVWTAHVDVSAMLERIGYKVSLVSAGKYKTEGHPYGPLSEEARAHLQAQVDEYYDMFVRAVARNRGASLTAVREGYGEGRVLTAKEAVKANLVDRVATLDQVIGELQQKLGRRRGAGAALERARIDIAAAEGGV